MTIRIKKILPQAILPRYGSADAAGADLYSAENVQIKPGETVLVRTGLMMELPRGYGGFIFARSGLAAKQGLAPANKVGVIDADYRGEILIALFNQSREVREIQCGDRIAQFVLLPCPQAAFSETDTLSETVRAEGGFGSTGK